MLSRRGFLSGLAAALAAPAVVKAEVLMPLRGIVMPVGQWVAEGGGIYSEELRRILQAQIIPLAKFKEMVASNLPTAPVAWNLGEDRVILWSAHETREILQHQSRRL